MKRITAITLFAVANLAMAGHSFAQQHAVQANVPFAFTVNSKLLPAGTYMIKAESPGLIVIRNTRKPVSALSLVTPGDAKVTKGGKLTFHRYGGEYFLSEVTCPAADMSSKIPSSKQEKQAQSLQARNQETSQIYVATR
jgi:hypothetical protein